MKGSPDLVFWDESGKYLNSKIKLGSKKTFPQLLVFLTNNALGVIGIFIEIIYNIFVGTSTLLSHHFDTKKGVKDTFCLKHAIL